MTNLLPRERHVLHHLGDGMRHVLERAQVHALFTAELAVAAAGGERALVSCDSRQAGTFLLQVSPHIAMVLDQLAAMLRRHISLGLAHSTGVAKLALLRVSAPKKMQNTHD